MSTATRLSDYDLVRRYTDQPARLPADVRAHAERVGGRIEAYAVADLDPELRFDATWLVLGSEALVLRRSDRGPEVISRQLLRWASLERALSCNTLRIGVGPSENADTGRVLVLRFTQRQRLAMDDMAALIEGRAVDAHAPNRDPDARYAERVARAIRDAQALVASSQLGVLWRLLGYLRPYRGQVTLGMAAAALITLLALVPPLVTGYLVDEVVGPVQRGRLSAAQVSTTAWLAVAGMATAYALRRLAAWVRLRSMAIIGEYVARDLRAELYAHLGKLSVNYYSRKKTGSLITRVSSDTDRLWEFLAFGVVDVSLSVVMLIGLSTVLIYLDPVLGLVMTLPVPLLCLGIHRNGKRLEGLFVRAWRKWSSITDHLSDVIPGVRVVKAFDQHARERQTFDRRNCAATAEFNQIHGVWTSFWPALMFAVELTIVAVWVFAIPRLLGTGGLGTELSLGTFVSFLLYTTMYVAPIEIIGQMARVMNRATTSAHRVFEVLDTEPDVVDTPEPQRFDVQGRVTFEHVLFAYDGLRQTIKGISFDVRPGEVIGLVGPSGGGKTTIVNLIARFYDPAGGRILIDGVDVRELDSGAYRRQVGMVLQDPYLFHGTVLENIRYGMPQASVAQVVTAAQVANAHDFICKLPHGYDTVVGERGHTLSGGERQRLSIARAVLADPKVLILDEATSAVDTETEQKIQEAMDRLVRGRTVFAIAHRLSTLNRADRLFVIEDGRLSECGAHRELIEKPGGTYRRLYQLQQQLHEAS